MFFFFPASPVYPKIGFSKKGFCQETFEKGLEKNKNLFKNRSKNLSQKIRGKNPAKKPSQVQQKIDTNFKTTTLAPLALAPKMGRRAPRAAPFLGLLFWILNRFFEGICWSFWLSFWPSFFLAWIFDIFLRHFFDIFFGQKIVKTDKNIFGQILMQHTRGHR